MVATVTLVIIYATLIYESIGFFQHVNVFEFLTGVKWTPLFEEKNFGVLPIFNATLITSAIAIALAAPAGLASAIFLSEYASMNVRSVVKPVIETLAGIPTVVYGYFALYFLTPEFLR